MVNSLTSIKAVHDWMDSNKCYIWTLYVLDGRHILTRNESDTDPTRSKNWIERELKDRSQYGGSFKLYIHSKKGNGGLYSDLMLTPQGGGNYPNSGVNGYGGAGGYHGIGSIDQYIADQKKLWELEREILDIKNAEIGGQKFWQRQIDKVTDHPDFDPNLIPAAVGGLAARAVSALEILLGVNGLKKEEDATTVNGTPERKASKKKNTEGGVGSADTSTEGKAEEDTEEQDEEVIYDGEALAVVCDDLQELYPNIKPEELLMKLKDMLKADPVAQALIKSKLKL